MKISQQSQNNLILFGEVLQGWWEEPLRNYLRKREQHLILRDLVSAMFFCYVDVFSRGSLQVYEVIGNDKQMRQLTECVFISILSMNEGVQYIGHISWLNYKNNTCRCSSEILKCIELYQSVGEIFTFLVTNGVIMIKCLS